MGAHFFTALFNGNTAETITGYNKLIRFRRMLGLFSLFYAGLHLLAYLAFMLAWQWQTLLETFISVPISLLVPAL